jgi:hypothetical protein
VELRVRLQIGLGTGRVGRHRVALEVELQMPWLQVEVEQRQGVRCSFALERPAYVLPPFRVAHPCHPS